MKIVFFTFYYPPDLCAGSFRAVALVQALNKKLKDGDELHVITTQPNRYASHRVNAEALEKNDKITIHRISVPGHKSGIISQARTFLAFARVAYRLNKKLKPDFLIGTTSRLMTGVLTWWSARRLRRKYYIDLRDIFSETISDLFARKSKLMGFVAKHIFSFFDRRVLSNAARVNVVSEGFFEYFDKAHIDTRNWTFFPNGVDQEFMNFPACTKEGSQNITTILYAGNIGNGQGLEIVIPAVAKSLGSTYQFVILGDGGTATLFKSVIEREGLTNVKVFPPVPREKLVEYYRSADILFLHLNDVPAFRRVLPSKIFEYAALGRPIVAGLSGYSAKFLTDNVPYACLFTPGNATAAESCIRDASKSDIQSSVIEEFTQNYSRISIMERMADSVLMIAKQST